MTDTVTDTDTFGSFDIFNRNTIRLILDHRPPDNFGQDFNCQRWDRVLPLIIFEGSVNLNISYVECC